MKIFNVGVDLHKTQFTVCIICGSEVLDQGIQYPMAEEGYSSFISRMHDISKEEDQICLAIESTGNARFFKQTMEEAGFKVVVVNTLKFKVVNMSTNKTDKHDAFTLASFLQKNMLPESHLCCARSEGIRRILKCRSLLVEDTVALKNQAHAVLLAYGTQTVPTQFQSKKGRLLILQKANNDLKVILSSIFETIEVVEKQIRTLECRLRLLCENDNTVKILMTIPGIGIVNACTISSYIDDIGRFKDYKHFSAFCGLVPWVQTSNNSSYYGRITKRGPQELRTALVQCVVAMARMPEKTQNTNLMRCYTELKDDKCSGKAIIATARKLTRIIYIMLTEDKPFNVNLA